MPDETKKPTIEDHIKRAKELTIPQVSVREEAFTELVKAVEKMNVELKATQSHIIHLLGEEPDANWNMNSFELINFHQWMTRKIKNQPYHFDYRENNYYHYCLESSQHWLRLHLNSLALQILR